MPSGRVMLLGDAHRLAYQPVVERLLAADGLSVVGPPGSTGGSTACAAGIDGWIEEFGPDIACFGCAPHAAEETIAVATAEWHPGTLEQYAEDLMTLAQRLVRFCGRQVVFVTALPVHEERLGATIGGPQGVDMARLHARRLDQYNELAINTLATMNVMVTEIAQKLRPFEDDIFEPDGFSLSEAGRERAATLVADGVYAVL